MTITVFLVMIRCCVCCCFGTRKELTGLVIAVEIPRYSLRSQNGAGTQLSATKRQKTSSTGAATILDASGHEVPWLREIRFPSFQSCGPRWLEFVGVEGSDGIVKWVL